MQTRVRERLDRFVANGRWFNIGSNPTIEHLVNYKSDHTHLFFKFGEHRKKKKEKKN